MSSDLHEKVARAQGLGANPPFAAVQQADILNSLLDAMLFLVCAQEFPAPIAGNSPEEVSCFNGFVDAGRGLSTVIPCIFPRIREFQTAETRLQQPPSTSGESAKTRVTLNRDG